MTFLPKTKSSFKKIIPYNSSLNSKEINYLDLDWGGFAPLTNIETSKGLIPFVPFAYQKQLINLSKEYQTIFVVKSRQMGATETVISSFLQSVIASVKERAVIFQNRQEDVTSVSGRLRQMLLPLGIKTSSDTISRLEFAGKGKIFLKNSSRHGTRSIAAVSKYLFDEAAFSANIEDIYSASSASSATVENPTKFIISTPSFASGWFFDSLASDNREDLEGILERVRTGILPPFYYWVDTKGICKVALHFSVSPLFQNIPNFLEARRIIDATSQETIEREYNLRFLDSSKSAFPQILINKQTDTNWRPTYGLNAIVGIDTSPSQGNDFTALTVALIGNDSVQILDYFHTNTGTFKQKLTQIISILKKHSIYKIAIESNEGSSRWFAEELSLEFPQIEIQLIHLNQINKLQSIEKISILLESEQIILPPSYASEMLTYRRNGSTFSAASTKHDDLLASLLVLILSAG